MWIQIINNTASLVTKYVQSGGYPSYQVTPNTIKYIFTNSNVINQVGGANYIRNVVKYDSNNYILNKVMSKYDGAKLRGGGKKVRELIRNNPNPDCGNYLVDFYNVNGKNVKGMEIYTFNCKQGIDQN